MSQSSATRAFLWSFLEQGGAKVVQMVVQIVLARLLAPDAFGLLAVLLVVTNIADSIAQSGFGTALIQKGDADNVSYDTAFWLSMGIALVIYGVIYALAPALASFYDMRDLLPTLRVLSLVVLFNAANSIQRSYMQKHMVFKGLFKVSIIAALVSGVIGVASAAMQFGSWALVIQVLSQSIFTCLVMLAVVPWKPHFRFRKTDAIELYKYGWKICVTGILNVLYSGISELILGKTCSSAELGYYSQGRKYPNAAIGVANNAIANVLFPALSEVRDDHRRLYDRVHRGLVIGTFITAPFSLWAASIASPVVELLLGQDWLACVPIFALACASNVFVILQVVNLRVYMAYGRSDLYMNLQILKVAASIVGIGGTAYLTHNIYCTAFATFFVGIINVLCIDLAPAKRLYGYSALRQLRDIAPSVSAAFIAFLGASLISILGLTPVLELLFQSIIFMAIYYGLARLTKMYALYASINQLRTLIGR